MNWSANSSASGSAIVLRLTMISGCGKDFRSSVAGAYQCNFTRILLFNRNYSDKENPCGFHLSVYLLNSKNIDENLKFVMAAFHVKSAKQFLKSINH